MEKFNIVLILFVCLLINQSFSQKSKPDTKPDPAETEKDLKIKSPNAYCLSTYTNTTDDWITNVTFNTINNSTGQDGTNSYGDYSQTEGTGVFVGNTYTLSVSFDSQGIYEEHVWAWIDWNGDEDFDDPGEAYDLGYGIDATLSINITVPNVGYFGHTRMRIIEQFDSDPTPCDPHDTDYGETEDYFVLISFNNYCNATGGCDEYISFVEIYSNYGYQTYISNCSGYFDYANSSWWIPIPQNGAGHIKVLNGNPYSVDQCGVWVDWNKDDDFDDPGESLFVSSSPGEGPYTAFITPPAGAALTDYHVRTRIVYNQTPSPCGTTTYGEVEDFHVYLLGPEISATWNGSVDNNWHNPYNWNTLKVPDATTDVIIPDELNKCWVYAGAAFCNNITVEYGSGNDLKISDQFFRVYGDFDMYGQLSMDHEDAWILAEGNITWHSGSTANISADALIQVWGDWTFMSGSNVHLDDGGVSFEGSGNSYIHSHEENCYFNLLGLYKTGGGWVRLSSASTEDLHIHDDITILWGTFDIFSQESVFLQGNLTNFDTFEGNTVGTLVFNGDDQAIMTGSGSNTSLGSTTINSSVKTEIVGEEISIMGVLTIQSGQFITNDITIWMMGNWDNQVGPDAFVEGTGKVVFFGMTSQMISDETFNVLELDTWDSWHGLQISGASLTCQQYDWTFGYLLVEDGGTFTANDLVDNGIYGDYYIASTGGTINISNYGTGEYVDLNGIIELHGGTMNVYGGDGPSFWPYTESGRITMTDGVLDFHDQGIYIYNSPTYTLTENITGGTIRTAGGFLGSTSEFTPNYGTMEFYGVNDAVMYTTNGCYLNDVVINKSSKETSQKHHPTQTLIDKRSGLLLGDGTKSNEITLTDHLDINGNLEIVSGSLNSDVYNIQIAGNWDNQVGPGGFDPGTGSVIFDGGNYHQYCSNESFNILEIDKLLGGAFRMEGTHVLCQQYDWTAGAVDVIPGGGSFTALDLYDDAIYGAYYLNPGGTINLHQDTDPLSYTDLNGELHIFGGIMNVYGGTGPSYWSFAGDALISMYDGVLDFHDHGIYAWQSGTYTLTESISGGTIRTAGGFWGENGDFAPDHGTIEFYSTNDAYIFTINGSNLNHVLINKALKKENIKKTKSANSIPLIDERSGKTISDGSKSNTISLFDFLDINGNLVIDNGVLNTDGYNIQIAGNWINNVGDAGFLESNNWVTFDGASGADILTNEKFANLMLNKTFTGIEGLELTDGITVHVIDDLSLDDGTLEMNTYSILDVDGNLFIANEAGLNADDANNIIYVGGNWTNENTMYDSYQGFTPYGEIVIFDGGSDQTLNTNALQEDFDYLFINKTAGNFKPNANIQVYAEVQIVTGDWLDYTSSLTHYFHYNVKIYEDGGYYPLGTTVFKGTYDQIYQNTGGIAMFNDVIVDKTNAKNKMLKNDNGNELIINPKMSASPKANTVTLLSDMTVYNGNNMTIDEGTFNLNGHTFTSTGDLNINSDGIMVVDTGAILQVNSGYSLNIKNNGTLLVVGTPGNPATVTRQNLIYYAFNVNSGGTLSAENAVFEYMDWYGVNIWPGAIIDPSMAFNYCTFQNVQPIAASSNITFSNDQVLTSTGANFPDNPFYNVYKDSNIGDITFFATTGDYDGPLYEYDPYNRIHWPHFIPGLWTGNVSSDWFDNMNWGDQQVPGPATSVVIPAGTPNEPVINNSIAYCDSLKIQAGASLEIGNDELIVGSIINIYGELVMNNSLGKLTSDEIEWQAGSTDDIIAGEIHVLYWTWQDGTDAYLGTGNTAFLTLSLATYDPDASFGNLEIVSIKGKSKIEGKGTYPVRVSGYCTMQSGTNWGSPGIDMIIDGNWGIESGGAFTFFANAVVTCYSDFTLNGKLVLNTGAEAIIHGMFNFASTGELDMDDATFICDHALSTGWIDLLGDITMTTGSLEFPDANISFAGTSAISGGTILAGRTFHSSLAGAFQPSGGKLELVGGSSGHYIQITNGNKPYELHISRSSPIGVHPGSPLIVQSYLIINSEFRAQGNTISVHGDLAVNAGGTLNLNENATLEMANNNWININNGGTLEAVGLPGNEAIVSHTAGYYNFMVLSGGTISVENAIFEFMGIDGLQLSSGAIVDPAYSFNGCVFENGVSGGQLLSIYNTQDFTVQNAIFPANTWVGSYNVYKNSTPGNVTFINATGDFAGPTFEYDPYNHVHWTVPGIKLDLTVFLEGPFNGSTMDTDINSILPINHPFHPTLPYFGNPLPNWFYTGADAVPAIPNPNVVDWILIELRDATDVISAIPSTAIATQAAFLLNDGSVVALDGTSDLEFQNTLNDQLFIVLWQRNHIGVISANPLVQTAGVYSYDFSTGAGQAFGGITAQKELSTAPVIWGMLSGDGDGDGEIQNPDKSIVWESFAGEAGYLGGDYNLNGEVNNLDKNDYWLPNMGSGSFIPE